MSDPAVSHRHPDIPRAGLFRAEPYDAQRWFWLADLDAERAT